MTLSLVCINTWKCDGEYHARIKAMARQLLALQPDVVACQEVFHTADETISTYRFLAASLSMEAIFLPARKKERVLQGKTYLSYSGLCLLTRLPLLEQELIELPSDPADGERLAQLVKLKWEENSLLLINTHLTHLKQGEALRKAQLQTILKQISGEANHLACILCGDFNALPDSREIRLLGQGAFPMTDAFAGQTRATHQSGRCIDYVFYRPSDTLVAREQQIVLDQAEEGIYPSDHFGLFVKFKR